MPPQDSKLRHYTGANAFVSIGAMEVEGRIFEVGYVEGYGPATKDRASQAVYAATWLSFVLDVSE